MNFSEETLMAYADGELDPVTRAALEAAMAADPGLADRVARHRALRARLRAAFDPVLDEPLPQRLMKSVRGAPVQRPAAKVIPLRRPGAPRWSWPQIGALAAGLVLGALLGPLVLHPPAGGAVLTRDGQMFASGALARALTEQLASRQPPTAPVQIGVSVRARDGAYCRSFVLREQSAIAGLACRQRDAWRLEVLAQSTAAATGGGYRAAGSPIPPSVARALDELREGEPLDAAAEAAARERGWAR
jgi:hypothetical protein